MATITIASSPSAGHVEARWGGPVLACWPRLVPRPSLASMSLDDLGRALRDEASATALAEQGPLLVILGPEVTGATLLRFADLMQQHHLPAVMLLPAVDSHARQLQSGGLIVEDWEAPPAFIAASLFALDQRQSTVLELSRDLAIATRYQGGVSGEIDRIHDELHLAAAVQQEMLPRRMPRATNVQFGILFRPAGYVSGDIYDVVELDEAGRYVGFFIADAVGHGVPAALMTMVISRSLRMTRADGAQRTIVSPAEAMTRLNDELCRGQRDTPRFTTAVYGVIDTHSRRVTLAGAGHPPPLRIRGHLLARVETDGPLLGVFPGERYTETSFTMADGETLLLYSDGFETAFAPSGDGDNRKVSNETYLREMSALPWPAPGHAGTAADALRRLEHRLDEQAGSLHQIDDVTAVAICAREAASSAPAQSDKTRRAA